MFQARINLMIKYIRLFTLTTCSGNTVIQYGNTITLSVSYGSSLLSHYMIELTVTPTKLAKLLKMPDSLFRPYIYTYRYG
jgi:hypothetical protein